MLILDRAPDHEGLEVKVLEDVGPQTLHQVGDELLGVLARDVVDFLADGKGEGFPGDWKLGLGDFVDCLFRRALDGRHHHVRQLVWLHTGKDLVEQAPEAQCSRPCQLGSTSATQENGNENCLGVVAVLTSFTSISFSVISFADIPAIFPAFVGMIPCHPMKPRGLFSGCHICREQSRRESLLDG